MTNQFTVTGVQQHRNRIYFQFNNAHDCTLAAFLEKKSGKGLVKSKCTVFPNRKSCEIMCIVLL